MSYAAITVEQLGPVTRILHNRPEARNAENEQLLDEMDQALAAANNNPDVRVIIIGGTGDHFSAGHDVIEGVTKRPNLSVEQRWAYEEKHFFEYAMRIWDSPKPTIAQVQGACVAGAFAVANMCDLIVCADDAFFSDPVCQTMGAAAVEMLVHPWVMGARQAKEFLYTGRRLPAQEALQWGLINRVVPRAQLEEETLALANHIAKAPPFAIKLTKRSIHRALDMQGWRTSLQAHFDTHELSHLTDEFVQRRAGGRRDTIAQNKSLEIRKT
ncbi:MAG: enoyl-CoA hydratase [Pseudomonadota bacterium]